MDQKKFQQVLANFTELEFIETGYYRLRKTDNGYKIAYLAPGPCGEKIQNPEITLEKIADEFQPVAMLDLAESPIIRLSVADDPEKIAAATESLLNKFIEAKNLA